LIIELEELKNSPERQLEIDFNEYISELNNSVDVTGHLTVKLMLYGVKIDGEISTELELNCDRCLNNFVRKLSVGIHEDFLFGTLLPEGTKEHELKENEFVNELKGQKFIDITDIIYQSIMLEIPHQALCSENCPGTVEYQKMKEEQNNQIDPRLSKLKDLNFSSN
jgi:uncharacterized protein